MMTRDEIIAMDNESLDSQVAQRIMGWKIRLAEKQDKFGNPCVGYNWEKDGEIRRVRWYPSTDIRDAFELGETIGRPFSISKNRTSNSYTAVFTVLPWGQEDADAATPARAITLGALLTVMREASQRG